MDSDKSKLNLLPSLRWWLPRGSALQRALPSQQALTHNLRGKRWHNTHCSLFASAFLFIVSLAKDNQTVPLGNLVLLYYLLSQLIFLFIFLHYFDLVSPMQFTCYVFWDDVKGKTRRQNFSYFFLVFSPAFCRWCLGIMRWVLNVNMIFFWN